MRKFWLWAALAAVAISVAMSPARSDAQESRDAERKEIELLKEQVNLLQKKLDTVEQKLDERDQRVQTLDQQVKVVDRKLEIQQEADQLKARDLPNVTASSNGLKVASQDHAYDFELHGLIEGDGRFFTTGNDKNLSSTFFLNRVRPILSGTVGKYYDFFLMPDFGQGRVVLQDAWVDARYFRYASLLAGKFKSPFGLERLQNDTNLFFSERALTNNLVPNRDIGAQLHGDLFDHRLTYQVAFLNGVPNNTASVDGDTNDGKDMVARVFFSPFRRSEYAWARGLGLGIAGTYGDERDGTTSVYKTFGQSTWFSYASGVTAAGHRYRYSPQAYYYVGPFGFLGEFVDDTHELNRFGNFSGKVVNDYETFSDHAWATSASYVLTGENASYSGVKPYHDFDPANGAWGAFELAGRISNLATDSQQFKLNFVNPTASAKVATEYAFGLNWYLNKNVKWQLAYARTYFDGGAKKGTFVKDRPDEGVFETQLQLSF